MATLIDTVCACCGRVFESPLYVNNKPGPVSRCADCRMRCVPRGECHVTRAGGRGQEE